MSKKTILALILIAICLGYALYELTLPNNLLVNDYKYRYEEMGKLAYIQQLKNYCKINLSDSIENKTWNDLLKWESLHLRYYSGSLAIRPEDPISILTTNRDYDGLALGRCGEFALLFTGLCLANNISVRLIVDCSVPTLETYKDSWITTGLRIYLFRIDVGIYQIQKETIKIQENGKDWIGNVSVSSHNIYFMDNVPEAGQNITIEFKYLTIAGDHVWNEILMNNKWIHVDTTVICQELEKNPEKEVSSSTHLNNPKMYVKEWHKTVNKVYAITANEVIDVTEKYQ